MRKRLFAIPAVLAAIGLALALSGCPVSTEDNHGATGSLFGHQVITDDATVIVSWGIAPSGTTAQLVLGNLPPNPDWVEGIDYHTWGFEHTPNLTGTAISSTVTIDSDTGEFEFFFSDTTLREFPRLRLIVTRPGYAPDMFHANNVTINRGTNNLARGAFSASPIPPCVAPCNCLGQFPGACDRPGCTCTPPVVGGAPTAMLGQWTADIDLPIMGLSTVNLTIHSTTWFVEVSGATMAIGTLTAAAGVVTLTATEGMVTGVVGTASIVAGDLVAVFTPGSVMEGNHTFTRPVVGGWCGCSFQVCEIYDDCDGTCVCPEGDCDCT